MVDRVLVGLRVARTHGNRGEVIVNLAHGLPEARFREGPRAAGHAAGGTEETLELVSVRFCMRGAPILGLTGVESITEAERYAGSELWVPMSEQEELPAGTYYHHQLLGCEVVTQDGTGVGRVTAVEGEHGANRLVVVGHRGEVLIPARKRDVRCRRGCAADRGDTARWIARTERRLALKGA
jgi:16S rRNA processing protein RimM